MRKFGWTPSIVPRGEDQNVYLVMDDLGQQGCVWREADSETTDLETIILDLLEGQYKSAIRGGGAICSSATFRSSCRISLIATKARYHDIQLPLPIRLV